MDTVPINGDSAILCTVVTQYRPRALCDNLWNSSPFRTDFSRRRYTCYLDFMRCRGKIRLSNAVLHHHCLRGSVWRAFLLACWVVATIVLRRPLRFLHVIRVSDCQFETDSLDVREQARKVPHWSSRILAYRSKSEQISMMVSVLWKNSGMLYKRIKDGSIETISLTIGLRVVRCSKEAFDSQNEVSFQDQTWIELSSVIREELLRNTIKDTKLPTSSRETFNELIVFRRMVLTNLVYLSVITNRYLFPRGVFIRSPKVSIVMSSRGTTTGKSFRSVTLTISVAFLGAHNAAPYKGRTVRSYTVIMLTKRLE